MDKYTIKTKKQDNGLWGTPICVNNYETIYVDDNKLLIISAVLTSLYELYYNPLSVKILENFFYVYYNNRNVFMDYKNYYVDDYTLYHFYNQDERKQFERKKKIESLL